MDVSSRHTWICRGAAADLAGVQVQHAVSQSPVALLPAVDANLAEQEGQEQANVVGHEQQPAEMSTRLRL